MDINTQQLINEAQPVLRAIAANMIKDGIADQFIEMSEEDRTEITIAYFADQIKKNEQMQTMFQTNPEFKEHFTRMVLAGL